MATFDLRGRLELIRASRQTPKGVLERAYMNDGVVLIRHNTSGAWRVHGHWPTHISLPTIRKRLTRSGWSCSIPDWAQAKPCPVFNPVRKVTRGRLD